MFVVRNEWRLENTKAFCKYITRCSLCDCAIPSYMLQPELSEFISEDDTHLQLSEFISEDDTHLVVCAFSTV
jgi:hypothetical protein